MLRIAICDDEKHFQEKMYLLLKSYLAQRKIEYEVDTYDSGVALMELKGIITKYEIIFLDISMDQIDGMKTAEWIRSYSAEIIIVFVTAYINYSVDGYKVDAIRYLLKDIDSFEMAFIECMDAIFCKMDFINKKILLDFQEGRKNVLLKNIVYVESNLHKLIFFIQERNDIVRYSMYERLDIIAEQLKYRNFCRIHKSYFVNLNYVKDLIRYEAILNNGKTLSVAKTRYKEVEKAYITNKGEI